MIDNIPHHVTVILRNAALYTDPFLMISGLLTSYSLFKALKRNSRINLAKEIVSRYLRVAPSTGILILLCAFIFPLLGTGPLYNQAVNHHSDLCKRHWSRNLLFIHNWFGFANMCLTHTHHLGIDMELFVAALPLVVLIHWRKRFGVQIVIGLAVMSTAMRYFVTIEHQLSTFPYFGQR